MTAADVAGLPAPVTGPGFAREGEHADVAVLVVTYRNAEHVEQLITTLRAQTGDDQRLRVVMVDNDSDDGTLEAIRAHDDVVAVAAGGNLGYAGGVNVAMEHAGDAAAVLVLNSDLELRPGCIEALRARLATSGPGVAVPHIVDLEGTTYPSLRREPSLLRAIGDAACGPLFPGRPGALSETIFDPARYEQVGTADWATGAALFISRSVADTVGPWDEQFFLYSEETDFLRRVREAGFTVWYEPAAEVCHERGGSGRSVELIKLMNVNRVRYVRKHHGRPYAALYRALVMLHAAARAYRPVDREVLRTLAREGSWSSLLQASGPEAMSPALPAEGGSSR